MTPLMVAARLGHSVLIDAMVCVLGADPNARNEVRGGWTGLHYACRYNQLDVVSILVKRGADFNLECHHGARPDDLAECHSHQDCMEAISVARRRRVDALKRQIVQEELKASSIRRTDLWVTDDKGNTLLMTAAEHGVYSALDTLLKMAGAPIDAQHEKTLMTALAMAAQLGNAEVVQLLLKSGANPTIHDIQDLLPLHHAVVHQHTVTMEIILQWPEALTGLQKALKLSGTVNIKQILSRAKHRRQQETVTPVLFECAMTGDAQKLYCVLEDGDNVNPTGGMGTWPIYLAVENGHEEIVHMLYERGADITRRHPTTGNTVLHMACARGHLKIARYLLGRYQREPLDIGCPTLDVAVNMYNKQGKTPLILASEKGYSCIVKLLLDHGASTAVVDSSGELYSCEEYQGVQALLENYRKRHLNSIVDAIRDKRGMKRLEEVFRPKFDHHLRDSTGDTPLMVACHQARVEAVKFLLKSAVYTLDHCCSTQRYRRRSTISNADSGAVVDPNSTFDPDQSHDPILTSSPILNSRLQDTNKELTVMNQSQPVLQTSRPTRTNGPKIQTNASLQKINECTALPTNTEQSCLDGEAVHEEVQEKSPNTAAHGESASPPSKTSRPRTKRSKVSEPQLPVTEEEDEDGPYQVPETISSLLESISSVSKGSLLISCNRLSHLAAVNPRDGATVYHRLVESGDNLTLFNLLLDSDESAVNIQDSAGLSPLHLACKLGRKKIVDKMTSLRHVDINCRTLDGKLPEEMATNKNIIKMVQNARAQNPPRSYSPLLSLTNSFFGAPIVSVTGSSVDFEQLNTRFTLMKHQLDLDVS